MALSLLAKSAFSGEFPLTAQFRSGPRNDVRSYQHWVDKQIMPEGYPVDLQTNKLRFSPNNYEYANRFAAENPNMLILSTWRAASGLPKGVVHPNGGDSIEESPISFPGHFVLSPGSTLTSSISSNSTTLHVESKKDMIVGPALVVETNTANGEKLWDRYEYVLITKVDGKVITVERQFNGSPEVRDFPAGTYVAPMPWDERSFTPYINFYFNLSKDCPRDDEGRTAMDVMFEDMLYPLDKGGALENIGGLDLASGPLTGTPNSADYDLDGVADPDSVYRDGVRTFYERIRDVLGPTRVLTTGDPDFEMIEYINGINQEGLANPDDPWEKVGRTVNRMLAWNRLATLPVASIVFSQYFTKLEEDIIRIQLQRMLNGYASCLGMAADIPQLGVSRRRGEAVDAIQRIELYKGDEKEAHWLGRSLGIKRPAEMTPNLLCGASSTNDWDKIIPALSVDRGSLSVEGDEMVLTPWEKDFKGYMTLDLNFELDEKADFTVFMEALSDDDQLMRKIYLPRVSVPVETGPVRAGISSKNYLPVSFYVRGAEKGHVMIDFRFAHGGPIRFKKLSVHKASDTLACEFEKGIVLVNPSLEENTFDLTKLFPNRKDYRRLSATMPQGNVPDRYRAQIEQALEINNGRNITDPSDVTIGERNALFLIANDASISRPRSIDQVRYELRDGVFKSCNWPAREKTEIRCYKVTFAGHLIKDLCPEACASV